MHAITPPNNTFFIVLVLCFLITKHKKIIIIANNTVRDSVKIKYNPVNIEIKPYKCLLIL